MSETGEEDYNRIWQELLARHEKLRTDAVAGLKDCAAPLAALGVRRIVWSYDGYGDSGQIENCEIQGASDTAPKSVEDLAEALKTLDAETQEKLKPERLEQFVYELLPEGFEINDGSYGTVMLETDTGTIHVGHNERYTDSTHSEFNY